MVFERRDWYPGLMQRTARFLARHAADIDLCLEIVDARAPLATRWRGLGRLLPETPRLLVLNKADLADQATTGLWLGRLRREGGVAGALALVAASSSGSGRRGDALRREVRAATAGRARPAGKGHPSKVAVVGVPNVGKSTVLNLLAGQHVAPTGAKPGLTRGERWVVAGPRLWLLDLPGVLPPDPRDASDVAILALTAVLPEGAYDPYHAATFLLRLMVAARGPAVLAHVLGEAAEREDLAGGPSVQDAEVVHEWLCLFARRRGLLLTDGLPDPSRAAAVVMAEFRRGRLGRLSLEVPSALG